MNATTGVCASAPGKIILVGEHAVVYGIAAIAVPVTQIQASATLDPDANTGHLTIALPDLGQTHTLAALPDEHPIAAAIRHTLAHLGHPPPTGTLTVRSTIPIAGGLGSGTAVSTAIIRALAAHFEQPLPTETVSALTWEVEKLHHGTPSGIDNTVVAYAQPVYFRRGQPLDLLHVGQTFTLVIGDTGIPSATRVAVGNVRAAWEQDPDSYRQLFERVGALAQAARTAIEDGRPAALGPLLDENHHLLQRMRVSSPELDRLVNAALDAGAQGAKLSGGGLGGNMLALVAEEQAAKVAAALQMAGAARVLVTQVSASD